MRGCPPPSAAHRLRIAARAASGMTICFRTFLRKPIGDRGGLRPIGSGWRRGQRWTLFVDLPKVLDPAGAGQGGKHLVRCTAPVRHPACDVAERPPCSRRKPASGDLATPMKSASADAIISDVAVRPRETASAPVGIAPTDPGKGGAPTDLLLALELVASLRAERSNPGQRAARCGSRLLGCFAFGSQ